MAIHAHSTPVPAFQRGLLPAAERPELPPEPLLAAAAALHSRRALEAAIEHGIALLAALGLPRLVEPDYDQIHAINLRAAVSRGIHALDVLDASDEDREDGCDDEPWLGQPEATVPLCGRLYRHFGRHHVDPGTDQSRWGQGPSHDAEEEHDGREDVDEDGDDLDRGEHDTADLEPSLGAIEQHEGCITRMNGRWVAVAADQRLWAASGLDDREQDDDNGIGDLDGLYEQWAGTADAPLGGYVG